jgi:hypothetical protein
MVFLLGRPSLNAFKQGVGMTRKRGTCVPVGLPPGEFPVPLFDVVANCITIRGSLVGTRRVQPKAESRPISRCSLYHRSTESSTGSSMAMCRHELSSNSCGANASPGVLGSILGCES